MTIPPNVSLKIHAPAGAVQVQGAVKNLDVHTSRGGQELKLSLHEKAVVRAVSGGGRIQVVLAGGARPRIDAKTSGQITGLKSDPTASNVLRLRSKEGDIVVRSPTE